MWPVDLPIQDQKAMPTPPRAEPAHRRTPPSSLEQAYPAFWGGLTPRVGSRDGCAEPLPFLKLISLMRYEQVGERLGGFHWWVLYTRKDIRSRGKAIDQQQPTLETFLQGSFCL